MLHPHATGCGDDNLANLAHCLHPAMQVHACASGLRQLSTGTGAQKATGAAANESGTIPSASGQQTLTAAPEDEGTAAADALLPAATAPAWPLPVCTVQDLAHVDTSQLPLSFRQAMRLGSAQVAVEVFLDGQHVTAGLDGVRLTWAAQGAGGVWSLVHHQGPALGAARFVRTEIHQPPQPSSETIKVHLSRAPVIMTNSPAPLSPPPPPQQQQQQQAWPEPPLPEPEPQLGGEVVQAGSDQTHLATAALDTPCAAQYAPLGSGVLAAEQLGHKRAKTDAREGEGLPVARSISQCHTDAGSGGSGADVRDTGARIGKRARVAADEPRQPAHDAPLSDHHVLNSPVVAPVVSSHTPACQVS